ncbi:unnamed protein product [Alopecurus aequalis]
MALASTTASRLIARRLSAPLPPPSSPSSAPRRATPRGGPRPRGFAVRWEGRPRALLGGFSDADAEYASDDEDEEDGRGALSGGGPSPPHHECDDVLELAAASSSGPERWDVLGLGQAMVDFSGMVDDEFLERLGIEKGTRKVVNHEERGQVLRAMDGCTYKAAAGGSLSNSLVALARLGSSRTTSYPELRIAMAGSVGSDPLGSFYRQKLRRANVQFLSKPVKDGTTGTVIVLTTPDAQRTMLAYQGTSSTLAYDSDLAELVSKSNLLVVEGYLFEFAHTIEAIKQACEDAKKNGAIIAVSASDVSCIKRCHSDFW